jgi:hypothetical protein
MLGRRHVAQHIRNGGYSMSVFMVERDLKGISMEDLAGAQKAAIATAAEMTANGQPISYIRSTFAPDDGRCMCLFDGESADQVRALNDKAGLPYNDVVPAMDLTP